METQRIFTALATNTGLHSHGKYISETFDKYAISPLYSVQREVKTPREEHLDKGKTKRFPNISGQD